MIAVSPDGSKIVYVANRQLYLKNSNELTAIPIRGTDEDPANPFFSPDGQWIGYFDLPKKQLKKISIMGGSPTKLCDINPGIGANWRADGFIIFGEPGSIMRVSENGGTPEAIVHGKNDQMLICPQVLPDGKSILFTYVPGNELQIEVQDLKSGKWTDLVPGGPARYLPTGHLVYGLGNDLYAVPFDLDTLKTSGGQIPVVEGVLRWSIFTPNQLAISDSGTLVYIPGETSATAKGTLVWVDRSGKEVPIEEKAESYGDPKISPDGTQVALTITATDGNTDIWIYDLVRKTSTRLTRNEAADFLPIWTPNGKRIIFCSEREDRESIFWKSADGAGKVERIASMEDSWIWPTSLSKDGSILFFGQWQSKGGYNIGMVPMEGDRTPTLLLQEEYQETDPQISPNGRWLAYVSNESSQNEVYIRPFPNVDGGGKQKVSTEGGSSPIWSPRSKELFYACPDSGLMVVSVVTDPSLNLGKPQRLIDTRAYLAGDIDPEGKRFLVIKEAKSTEEDSAQGRPNKIIIVTNWFEELKEKVPVD